MMFSMGSLYAWSVFVAPLEARLGASRAEISSVFSLAIVCFTLAMLFGAALHRYVSAPWLGLLAGALAVAGFLLAGLLGDSLVAIGLGVGGLFGIANGLGYGLSLQAAQAAAVHRRGLMTGLAVASYTAGSAAFSGLFAWGIARLDVPATFVCAAFYMAVIAVAVFLLLRLSGISIGAAKPQSSARPWSGFDRSFWILWFGFFFAALAGVMVLGHAAAIVGALGGSARAMALGAALVALGNGVGRLAGGWLTDWQPPRRFLSALLLLAAIALLSLLVWPFSIMAMASLTLMGLGYGSMAGAYPVIVSRLYGLASLSRVYGRIFTAWGAAGLAGPYLGGLLFDRSGSYQEAIAAALAAALLGSVISLAIRLPHPSKPV